MDAASNRTLRTLFVMAAIVCFSAAFLTTPSAVRSQFGQRSNTAPAQPVRSYSAARQVVVPALRDPFTPRSTTGEMPLPDGRRLPIRSTARVTAIATGPHPTALVESGGVTRAVTIGDELDSSRISEISGTTVILANGIRLSLDAAPPEP